MSMNRKIGDRLKVLASQSLGTPETMGTILSVEDYYYAVSCDDDEANQLPTAVDEDGTVMVGPPIDGKLVRFP